MTFWYGLVLAGALFGGLSACGEGIEADAISATGERRGASAMLQEPAAASAGPHESDADVTGGQTPFRRPDDWVLRTSDSATAIERSGLVVVTCSDSDHRKGHVQLTLRGEEGRVLESGCAVRLDICFPKNIECLPAVGDESANLLRASEDDQKTSHTIADSERPFHVFTGPRGLPIRFALRSTCLLTRSDEELMPDDLRNVLIDTGHLNELEDSPTFAPREIWLILSYTKDDTSLAKKDPVRCTIAPFIFQSELSPPERIRVALVPDEFVRSGLSHDGDGNARDEDERGNLGFVIHLLRIAEEAEVPHGDVVVTHPASSVLCDPWAQDSHFLAYATGPDDATAHYALRALRHRSTQFLQGQERNVAQARALFHFPDAGDATLDCSQDYGGNFVVSPPIVAAAGTPVEESQSTSAPASHLNAPYGKIIYGEARGTVNPPRSSGPSRAMLALLDVHNLQSTLSIDVTALKTGHVDEVVSFIPSPKDGVGRWKMLVASTRLAHKLLYRLHERRWRPDGSTLLESWTNGHYVIEATDWSKSLTKFGVEFKQDTETEDSLERWVENNAEKFKFAYPKLDRIRRDLMYGLPVGEEDTIDVPVLFEGEQDGVVAFLPNMVNLQVLGNTLVVPKSFGPRVALTVGREILAEEGVPTESINQAFDAGRTELTHDVLWMSLEQAENLEKQLAAEVAGQQVQISRHAVTKGELPGPLRRLFDAPETAELLRRTGENLDAGTWFRVELTWTDSIPLFEAYVIAKLIPLGVHVRFVDDWLHYHSRGGDVHCGTSVSRSIPPLSKQYPWWEQRPKE